MTRIILIGLGVLSTGTAVYIWAATQHWYDNVPGVAATGPLNLHFAKDVALAYLASGGALIWAAVKSERSVGVFRAMWIHRGLSVDVVAAANLFGIRCPKEAKDVWGGVMLASTLEGDCGPCVQLVVDMALEVQVCADHLNLCVQGKARSAKH